MPTSSQKKYIWKSPVATTRPSIENVKKESSEKNLPSARSSRMYPRL